MPPLRALVRQHFLFGGLGRVAEPHLCCIFAARRAAVSVLFQHRALAGAPHMQRGTGRKNTCPAMPDRWLRHFVILH
jgi:hypothetical protein